VRTDSFARQLVRALTRQTPAFRPTKEADPGFFNELRVALRRSSPSFSPLDAPDAARHVAGAARNDDEDAQERAPHYPPDGGFVPAPPEQPAPKPGDASPVRAAPSASNVPASDSARSPEESELSDVVRRAAAGDSDAWAAIGGRYGSLVRKTIASFRLTGADATNAEQLTWLQLMNNLDQIHHPERLGDWLSTTAARQCLLLLRERRMGRLPERRWQESPAEDTRRSDVGTSAERLQAAFTQLSDHCQQVLLSTLATEDVRDVAASLAMPIGAVGPTRTRCLKQLRALVNAEGDELQVTSEDPDRQP